MQLKTAEALKVAAKFNAQGYYNVPIFENSCIHECLGRVLQKNDGRWEWWRWPAHFSSWNGQGQGVCLTREEAEAKVVGGWDQVKEVKE